MLNGKTALVTGSTSGIGREIWDFPKKNAKPKLEVVHDTLTGTLEYAGIQVAIGITGYKHQHLPYDVEGRKACSSASIVSKMSKTQVNLKLIESKYGT